MCTPLIIYLVYIYYGVWYIGTVSKPSIAPGLLDVCTGRGLERPLGSLTREGLFNNSDLSCDALNWTTSLLLLRIAML